MNTIHQDCVRILQKVLEVLEHRKLTRGSPFVCLIINNLEFDEFAKSYLLNFISGRLKVGTFGDWLRENNPDEWWKYNEGGLTARYDYRIAWVNQLIKEFQA
jgi:hypothetical protein